MKFTPKWVLVAALGPIVAMGCVGDLTEDASSDGSGRPGVSTDPNDPNYDPNYYPNPDDPSMPLTCTEQAQLTFQQSGFRRLSSLEYGAAVKEALGVNVEVTLPADASVGAFIAGPDIAVTEQDTQRYLDAALRVAGAYASQLSDSELCSDAACIEQKVEQIGLVLFRRPLDEQERARYRSLYDLGPDPRESVRIFVAAMLQSPHFLYRLDRVGTASPSHDVVTRLSFAFRAGPPNQSLLEQASSTDFTQRANLEPLIDGWIDQAQSGTGPLREVTRQFVYRWLRLNADEARVRVTPDGGSLGDGVDALTRSFDAFIDNAFWNQGAFGALLTDRKAFVSEQTAQIYGVPHSGGSALESVELPADERSGLLTRLFTIASHSHVDQSAPILRGATVLENVICAQLGDPPDNFDPPEKATESGTTTREQADAATSSGACQSCHQTINPIGFAFEHYDQLGAYRTLENETPIDASGNVTLGGETFAFDDAVALSEQLASSRKVQDCFARQWLRFVSGANLPQCSETPLTASFVDSGGDLAQLLRELAIEYATMSEESLASP